MMLFCRHQSEIVNKLHRLAFANHLTLIFKTVSSLTNVEIPCIARNPPKKVVHLKENIPSFGFSVKKAKQSTKKQHDLSNCLVLFGLSSKSAGHGSQRVERDNNQAVILRASQTQQLKRWMSCVLRYSECTVSTRGRYRLSTTTKRLLSEFFYCTREKAGDWASPDAEWKYKNSEAEGDLVEDLETVA